MALTLSDRRLLNELGIILTLKLLFIFCIKIFFFSQDEADNLISADNHFFDIKTEITQEKTLKTQPTITAKMQSTVAEKEQ
ncbi:MAG: hypothetical protein K0U59_08330 [Gammaproteobacteria bacterium]|nr:hypothetical protein [Gammaproteobacteria bacterium]